MLKRVVGIKSVESTVEVTVDDGWMMHTQIHTFTVLLTDSHNKYFSLRILFFFSHLRLREKARGLVRLSEAEAIFHQGHSQWIITLRPGPKL